MRSSEKVVVVLLLLMVSAVSLVHSQLPTYFMDEWCSTTLDMNVHGIMGGRLLLRPPERGMRYLHCYVFIKAPPGRRLGLQFRAFDIQSPFDCDTDYLQMFDDTTMRTKLTDQMCNVGATPHGTYTTTGVDAAIRVFKKNYLADQIELIFTAYHEVPCKGDEFQCTNEKCIHKDLYCNGYDNCGDGSDMCFLSTAGIVGVVIGAIVLLIIIALIIAACVYRRQQHHRKEKMEMSQDYIVLDANGKPVILHENSVHYVDAWDKDMKKAPPSTLSTHSSFLSSALREKLNRSASHSNKAEHSKDHDFHKLEHSEDQESNKHGHSDHYFHSDRHSDNGGMDNHHDGGMDNNGYEETPSGTIITTVATPKTTHGVLKTSESFKSQRSSGSTRIHFGPLKSSTLKKSKSESGLRHGDPVAEIYSVPRKTGSKKKGGKLKKKNSSLKYMNDPVFYHRDFLTPGDAESQMFERNPSFREGMKGESESGFPIHTLDPATLPGATRHLSRSTPNLYRAGHGGEGYNVSDHVISFRSYPAPEMSHKERVIYLYPGRHYGYQHLPKHQHGDADHDHTLKTSSGHSAHSSRSSLVKH